MRLWPRRIRYIPQLEITECGAASLAMVLDYHGCAVPLADARAACAVSRDGVNAARILHAARAYGLRARGLRLDPKDLKRLPTPAILHWEFNHFLVLERMKRRGAVLVDPASGRRFVSDQQLSHAFTGVVLAFEPTDALPRRRQRAHSLSRYFTALADEKGALAFVIGSALLLQLVGLFSAASTQVLVDHVIKPQRSAWLMPVCLALLMATALRHTLQWLRDRVFIGIQMAMDLTLLSSFVSHLVRLPLAFFEQRTTGDLMQRVDANDELRTISTALALNVLDGLMLVSYACMMLAYDRRLGALTLAVSLSRVLVVQLTRRRMRQGSDHVLSLAGGETAAVVEALAAPETTRALGAESLLFRRYGDRMGERLNAELALQRASHGVSVGMTLFDGAAAALLLWVGGTQVIAGAMTIGVFAGFMILQRLVDAPLSALLGGFDRLLYAQAILARVDDVLASRPEPAGQRVLEHVAGRIAIDRVSFRHGPSSPLLLHDLSLRVEPGEKVALVGRSGQGKSTLLKLLLGVIRPSEGRILLDGVELEMLARQPLAAHVGVVMQEPFLLADTVATNLRLRVPDASLEELEHAARLACIHDVIAALPSGYETRLGEGGMSLSGGQRQRLAIARALVGRPGLLLLDEATSSLDLETEAAVHANLGSLGCTRIVIAHRLSTVRDADRILVLEGGTIVQEGRYDELAAAPGLFRALLYASGP